jgi:hypothetical protein
MAKEGGKGGLVLVAAIIGGAFMAGGHGGSGAAASASGYVPSGTIHCRGLEHLWVDAGGDPGKAQLMASIGMAESSGDQNATSSVGAEGYWQINPAAWPQLATYDPLGNAKAAVIVLRKQGLGAWSSYTNGSYAGKC